MATSGARPVSQQLWIFGSVAVLGAIGGALGVHLPLDVLPEASATDPRPLSARYLRAIPFGALASVVLVFVVANTDRSDLARLFSIAALAGVFWEPVIDAGRLYVARVGQVSAQQQVSARLGEAEATIARAKEGQLPTDQARAELDRIAAEIREVAPDIRDADLLQRLQPQLSTLEDRAQDTSSAPLIQDFNSAIRPSLQNRIVDRPAFPRLAP